ncbi:MAG: DUF2721 domain-containing protein [Desulfobulbaceae bacterium]|nr:DUF2721 domain-containing protein [Desulfobulbaceae bacterium]
MDITLTTPALLFPAISLLLVAYTNRFLALGSRIRSLHAQYREHPDELLVDQIKSLRQRVLLIRNMQAMGVASLFCCVFCMFTLFAGKVLLGKVVFGTSLLLLMGSLGLSFREVLISVHALKLELRDMESPGKAKGKRS